MEVLPSVYHLPAGKREFMGVFPSNVYLVVGERAALIDSGPRDEAPLRLEAVKSHSVSFILITHHHPDHCGGAELIKSATGALFLLHPQEGEGDRPIAHGEKIELGGKTLEVIHTPGHTPGHCCFWLREEGVLFSGDHILGLGTTVIVPPQGDMAQYMDSLRRLLGYPLSVICPGHGPLVRQARAKIEELLRHRQQREEQVLACLRRGMGDIPAMVREIYPELDPRLRGMAHHQLRAHLFKLLREGKAKEEGGSYVLA